MNAIDRIAWLHRIVLSNPKLAALKVAVILADFCDSKTGKAWPGLHARLGRIVTQDGIRWLKENGFIYCMRDAYRGEPAVYKLDMPKGAPGVIPEGAEGAPNCTPLQEGAEGAEGAPNHHPLKGAEGAPNSSQRGAKKGAEGAPNCIPHPGSIHGMIQGEGEREPSVNAEKNHGTTPPLPPLVDNSQPPAETPEQRKARGREALTKALRKAGFPLPPGAVDEWADLLRGRGGCKTPAEASEGVAWIARKATQEGARITFAKHAGTLADLWAKILQDRRETGPGTGAGSAGAA